MGKYIGHTSNLEGDDILVTFESDSMPDDQELSVVSIAIQMDGGGGEYHPIKYTTASIGLLADGFELIELFRHRYVRVSVVNESTNDILFYGWVSPNNYNLALTGCNDVYAIECVDTLGFGQFEPYVVAGYSPRVLTLGEIAARVSDIIGAKDCYMAASISLRREVGRNADETVTYARTRRYDLMTLCETYFVGKTPEVMPDGLTYGPTSMSCYDVLSMIAESLRLTWIQVGDSIWLYDCLQAVEAGETEWFNVASNEFPDSVILVDTVHNITEDSFSAGESQISALPRYSLVSLERAPVEEMDCTPDLFDNKFLTREGNIEVYDSPNQSGMKIAVQELISGLYDLHSNTYGNARIIAVSGDYGTDWGYEPAWPFDDATTLLRIQAPMSPDAVITGSLLARKLRYPVLIQPRDSVCFILEMEAKFSNNTESLHPRDLIDGRKNVYVSLKVGNMYYNPSISGWQKDFCALHLLTDAKKNDWVRVSILYFMTGDGSVYAPSFGVKSYWDIGARNRPAGEVEFGIHAGPAQGWNVMWVRTLRLRAVPTLTVDNDTRRIARADTQYKGTWSFLNAAPTVSLPIQNDCTLAEKWWGAVIDGEDYYSGLLSEDGAYTLDIRSGDKDRSMLDRIEALTNFGDGIEYVLPMNDEHNRIKVYDVFACPSLWSGYKVAVAIERDVLNSSINITLD